MATLENAIEVALKAHTGHKDRNGCPYILHPLHVMMQMDEPSAMMAAVLHDVVEDSDITLQQLRAAGFGDDVVEAVALLTHDKGTEDYLEYVRRIKPNALARKIKLGDLKHNMDLLRMNELTDHDLQRLKKYHTAWQILTK